MNQRFTENGDSVPNNLLLHSSRAFADELPVIIEPSYSSYPYAAQDLRLHEHNYQRVESIGDGWCFSRSVSYCLFNSQDYHPYVREVVVNHLHINYPRYFPNWKSEDVRAYLFYMSKTVPPQEHEIWADERVIQATADVFCVKIVRLFDSGNPIRYTVPLDRIYKKTIHLGHIKNHVDAMLPANVAPYKTIHPLEPHRKESIKLTGYFSNMDLAKKPATIV